MKIALILFAALLISSCGTGYSLGHRCTSSSECASTLTCLTSECADAGCASASGWAVCSQRCTTNAECTTLDSKAVCSFAGYCLLSADAGAGQP